MKRIGLFFLTVALGTAFFGCKPSATSAPPAVVQPAKKVEGTPQPKLPTIKLYIGNKEMETEIAADNASRQTGMMFRKSMGENEGMIFVFPYAHRTAFWMKNTTVPLSAAYIDPEGVILEIHKLEPLNENSVEAKNDDIQYVLETPQGWFERNKISVGTAIATEHGPLAKILKTNR